MVGIQAQVLKIISLFKGINKDEISAVLGVSPQYIAEICQHLAKEGYLMASTRARGYVLKGEAKNEIKYLVKGRKVVYEDEIYQRLSISSELTSKICQTLVKENFLVTTAKGGYVLKEDLDLVLKTIRDQKETTSEDIAQKIKISPQYAALLCRYWLKNFSILKTRSGKYIPASKDASHLLKIIKKYACLNKTAIIKKMRIGPGYADMLCNSLVKQGYLKVSIDGEYFSQRHEQKERKGNKKQKSNIDRTTQNFIIDKKFKEEERNGEYNRSN